MEYSSVTLETFFLLKVFPIVTPQVDRDFDESEILTKSSRTVNGRKFSIDL